MKTNIEIIHPLPPETYIRHALFDFNGTFSLIREGWQEIMIPMMVDLLMQTPEHEEEAEVTRVVKGYVTQLTGKQTIYLMMQLAEEIIKRGGTAESPDVYKDIYQTKLLERIQYRREGLRNGNIQPEEYLIPGSVEILQALKSRGVKCYLVSEMDEKYVLEDADLLQLTPYFDEIHGTLDDYVKVSKKMIIKEIILDNNLTGSEFVGTGDGFVEIENTKAVNGIAIGVAPDEKDHTKVDPWKRERLIQAGADLIIPNFIDTEGLIDLLFQGESKIL